MGLGTRLILAPAIANVAVLLVPVHPVVISLAYTQAVLQSGDIVLSYVTMRLQLSDDIHARATPRMAP